MEPNTTTDAGNTPYYDVFLHEFEILTDLACRRVKTTVANTMGMIRLWKECGLWLNEDGEEVTAAKLTSRSLLATMRDLVMADAAIHAMMQENDGCDEKLINDFENGAKEIMDAINHLLFSAGLKREWNEDPLSASLTVFHIHYSMAQLTHPNMDVEDYRLNFLADFKKGRV